MNVSGIGQKGEKAKSEVIEQKSERKNLNVAK
jgi:hypothetical protein